MIIHHDYRMLCSNKARNASFYLATVYASLCYVRIKRRSYFLEKRIGFVVQISSHNYILELTLLLIHKDTFYWKIGINQNFPENLEELGTTSLKKKIICIFSFINSMIDSMRD